MWFRFGQALEGKSVLQAHARRRVAREHLPQTDVTIEHFGRLVPRLALDQVGRHVVPCSLGYRPRAEAMSSDALYPHPGAGRRALDDVPHAVRVQSDGRDPLLLIDCAVDEPRLDLGAINIYAQYLRSARTGQVDSSLPNGIPTLR